MNDDLIVKTKKNQHENNSTFFKGITALPHRFLHKDHSSTVFRHHIYFLLHINNQNKQTNKNQNEDNCARNVSTRGKAGF